MSHWFDNIIGFGERGLLHPLQCGYGGPAAPVDGHCRRGVGGGMNDFFP
jgi:hypothetical protein